MDNYTLILQYWEKRRLWLNVILLVVLVICSLILELDILDRKYELFGGGIIFFVFINVLYSFGPYINLVFAITFKSKQIGVWRWLYYLGLITSAFFLLVLSLAVSFTGQLPDQ
ncbi:hypothetical protein MNBD_GAMMA12-3950 [hydrothermal vent metagenome]|uniref:Uncharacterized protein n=1 Tax=hydrothermal vent metagenome TaxID=652676 RepID=A0A3B0YYP3_9ZZZZ